MISNSCHIVDLLTRLEELQEQLGVTSFQELLAQVPEVLAQARELHIDLDELERRWNQLRFMNERLSLVGHSNATTYPTIPGFEIIDEISRGGMGVVLRAHQVELRRDVAIKLIMGGKFALPRTRQRFHAEAQSIARLHDAHVLQIFDTGDVDGELYIVMELLEGGTLHDRLAEGHYPMREAAQLVEELARAIENVHRLGILHRDLKPANILFDSSGRPKIGDFGLAKVLDGDDALTMTGEIIGSPSYMAPEQISGSGVGVATDVYGLGTILYESLTGQLPFQGDSTAQTLVLVQRAEPLAPRCARGEIPRDLEAICLKCLEKTPQLRYRTAAELAADLRRWLNGEPTLARPIGTAGRLQRWVRRDPVVATLVSVVIFATLSAATGLWWHNGQLRESLAREQESRVEANTAQHLAEQREQTSREYRYAAQVKLADVAWQSRKIAPFLDAMAAFKALRADAAPDFASRFLDFRFRQGRYEFRTAYSAWCNHVDISPDGNRIVACYEDGALRIWDYHTRALLLSTRAHEKCCNQAHYTADGTKIISVSCDQSAKVWNANDLSLLARWSGHTGAIWQLELHPDERRVITADDDGVVIVWDIESGRPLAKFVGHDRMARCLDISRDGRWLAVGGTSANLWIWDLHRAERSAELNIQAVGAFSLRWLDPGKTLAVAVNGGNIQVIDVASGSVRQVLYDSEQALRLEVSSDGNELLSAAGDGTVQVFDAQTRNLKRMIRSQDSRITSIAKSSSDKAVATSSYNGTAVVHRFTELLPDRMELLPTSEWSATAICTQSGRLAVGSATGQVLLSNVGSLDRLANLDRKAQGGVRHLEFSHDGTYLLVREKPDGSDDEIWRISDGGPVLVNFDNHVSQEEFADLFEQSRLASGRAFRVQCLMEDLIALRVTRLYGDGAVLRMPSVQSGVTSYAFSPDGLLLGITSLDGAVLYRTENGQRVATLLGHQGAVMSVAFSPDGRVLATGGKDGSIRLWSTATGQEMVVLTGHERPVAGLGFSRDGQVLASWNVNPHAPDMGHDWTSEILLWHAPFDDASNCDP